MAVKAEIVSGVSKKSGKEYIALRITFPNGFEKLVFPKDSAEAFIFKQSLNH